jgi:hypothetical protein
MKWFTRGSKGSAPAEPPRAAPPGVIAPDDPRIAEGHARLDRHWAGVGRPDPDLISYAVNPQFSGAPDWPNTRQAFRVIRRQDALILASDGLSDPFVGTGITDRSGLSLEVFAEFPGFQDLSQRDLVEDWRFGLVEMVARNLADWGGLQPQLDRLGVMSAEFPAFDGFPEPWVTEGGSFGVLFGLPVPGWGTRLDLPFGPVRLVPVTLLHPQELATVASGGATGRAAVAAALAGAGVGHRTDTGRGPAA